MCGRYIISSDPTDLEARFESDFHPARPETFARYDVRPTHQVPIVSMATQNKRVITNLAWGLIPSDENEGETPRKHTNARADTIDFYGCFRQSFRQRRCLMIADGFYEWRDGVRHLFRVGGLPFAIAAIWDSWPVDGSTYYGCCLITTDPNPVTAAIHNRMPVILRPDQWAAWLNPNSTPSELLPMLRAYGGELSVRKVTDPADDRTPPELLPDDYVAAPKPKVVRRPTRAGSGRRVRGGGVERAA
jgi:putative SOS response-associated peptidase YedK